MIRRFSTYLVTERANSIRKGINRSGSHMITTQRKGRWLYADSN